MMLHRHRIAIALIVVLAGVALAAGVWGSLLPSLSSARNEPSAAEVLIATWLLQESVPAAAKMMVNPLGGDPADIAAGRNIFRQKCEICHGYDGSGKTEVGAGQYPRSPALQANIAAMPGGEIFYHIRNGPAAHVQKGRHGLRLWQQVEAALFHQGR
jgi:mono/diheme cytochrome c family protein